MKFIIENALLKQIRALEDEVKKLKKGTMAGVLTGMAIWSSGIAVLYVPEWCVLWIAAIVIPVALLVLFIQLKRLFSLLKIGRKMAEGEFET